MSATIRGPLSVRRREQAESTDSEEEEGDNSRQHLGPLPTAARNNFDLSGSRVPPASALPARPSKGGKRRKRQRNFLEKCLLQLQRPEVILLGVWWLIIFVLTVYIGDFGGHLRAIWRPLVLLASIPIVFALALCIITL